VGGVVAEHHRVQLELVDQGAGEGPVVTADPESADAAFFLERAHRGPRLAGDVPVVLDPPEQEEIDRVDAEELRDARELALHAEAHRDARDGDEGEGVTVPRGAESPDPLQLAGAPAGDEERGDPELLEATDGVFRGDAERSGERDARDLEPTATEDASVDPTHGARMPTLARPRS